jgi:tRNA threonylcarbamoyladenosine modification (KEOPS) complex  Pcc1 subunit
MKSSCTLELEFPDEKTARNTAKALELDNAGYIEARVEGNILYATTTADNVMSLRNTLDDFLAGVTVAQKSLEGVD